MVETAFKGAGGGGGGGGSYTNTPDNLRSTDTFEGLMGMCVGPIKGPVGGLKGVKLDGTAIINDSDEENFPGFIALYSDGDPTQFPQLVDMRLGSAAAPNIINTNISNTNTGTGMTTPGPYTSRTLSNVAPNYIDLRFVVQQLFRQDEKGIYTTTATLDIQLKKSGTTNWVSPTTASGGTWTPTQGSKTGAGITGLFGKKAVDQSASNTPMFPIKAKTTSPAVVELRVWVPNEGAYSTATWDVRVRLMEREEYSHDDDVEQRQILWESMAAIYNETIGEEEDWRGLSWLQLYGQATDNLKGVPEVEVIADTKIVSVPPSGVWNAATRAYTGTIWDGSWAKQYTNDPAWIINDAISDPLSGLAKFAPGAHLNKWDALEASKWFSTLVPDGAGGYHPRYSLNVVHNQPMKAEEFIRYLGGAVGAMVWDNGDGEWRMKVDKPEVPVDIFTPENIEGEFTYTHTDVDTRYNDYRGTFLNEEFDFREETIGVVDNASIALIGQKPTTVALIGCTNRQEALRRLMLRLRSSTRETRVVNFTTNRRADHLVPLETILVADTDLGDQTKKTTGRVMSVAADRLSVTVRDPIRLEVGVTYKVKFALPNADYDPDTTDQPPDSVWTLPTLVTERNITNTSGQRGDVTTLYLDTALPSNAAEYLVVALEATGLPAIPKMYRILSLSREDGNENERVSVSAVEVDTGKWAAADGVTAADSVYLDLTQAAPAPIAPTGGPFLSIVSTPAAQSFNHSIIGNFVRPLGNMVDGFKVTYSINGGTEQVLHDRLLVTTFDLVDPAHGDYEFKVYTRTRAGALSAPLIGTLTVDAATLSAADIAYADGRTLESLQPSQAGADPTGANVAAGILGQGALATSNFASWTTQVSSRPTELTDGRITTGLNGSGQVLSAGGDANRVRFSRMEQGNAGYDILYNPAGVPQSLNTVALTPARNAIKGTFTFSASSQSASIGTAFGYTPYRIPVAPGERLAISTAVDYSGTGATYSFEVGFFNSSGGVVSQTGLASGTVSSNTQRVGGFITVPAGASYAWLEMRIFNNSGGAGVYSISMIEPMVSSAGVNQTVLPSFTPGPSSEFGATVGAIWGGNIADPSGTLPANNATQNGIGPNMLIDDTFLPSKWAYGSESVRLARNSSSGFAAGFAPYCLETTGASTAWGHSYWQQPNITVGKRYFASVHIQKNSSVSATTTIYMGIAWFNSAGTAISTSENSFPATDLTAGAVPKQYTVSGIAPAGAVFMSVLTYVGGTSIAPTGKVRFELPVLSEVGATAAISGPTTKEVKYDYTVTALSGELPANLAYTYQLNGVTQTAGVTWTYQVLTGTVNGFTVDDGIKSMSGSGTGTLTISSVGTDAATVKVIAVQNGLTTSIVLALSRNIGAAPTGGGGSSSIATGSVTGTTASSTYADKTGSITGTMPAGKTTANIVANLQTIIDAVGANQTEDVTFKLERNISGTWTQIGSTVLCRAKERFDVDFGWITTPGANTMSISDTGLTAGNTYSWRISAARTSGSHTNYLSGDVTVTAP